MAGFEPATSTSASRVINPGRHLGSPGAHQVGGALSTELHGTGKGRASRNKPNVPPAPRDRLSDPSRQSVKRRPCRFHGLFQGFTRYRPTVSARALPVIRTPPALSGATVPGLPLMLLSYRAAPPDSGAPPTFP